MDESALERLSIIKALKLMSDRFSVSFSDNQIICASQWFQFHGLCWTHKNPADTMDVYCDNKQILRQRSQISNLTRKSFFSGYPAGVITFCSYLCSLGSESTPISPETNRYHFFFFAIRVCGYLKCLRNADRNLAEDIPRHIFFLLYIYFYFDRDLLFITQYYFPQRNVF